MIAVREAFVIRHRSWKHGNRKTTLEEGCSSTNTPFFAITRRMARYVLTALGHQEIDGRGWNSTIQHLATYTLSRVNPILFARRLPFSTDLDESGSPSGRK